MNIAAEHNLEHYNIRIVDHIHPAGFHDGVYNAPVADEVAYFLFGENEATSGRDMVIRYAI